MSVFSSFELLTMALAVCFPAVFRTALMPRLSMLYAVTPTLTTDCRAVSVASPAELPYLQQKYIMMRMRTCWTYKKERKGNVYPAPCDSGFVARLHTIVPKRNWHAALCGSFIVISPGRAFTDPEDTKCVKTKEKQNTAVYQINTHQKNELSENNPNSQVFVSVVMF